MSNNMESYKTNIICNPRKQSYKEWFDSPIKSIKGDLNETHGDYIIYFYGQIKTILKANQVEIHNEKQFKRELATFIYRLSSED